MREELGVEQKEVMSEELKAELFLFPGWPKSWALTPEKLQGPLDKRPEISHGVHSAA